jgi:2-dehydro-3-deoxyphosphogluconate aldolase/(4S)-4-hydroxy-2-oxoglutarate aldolase
MSDWMERREHELDAILTLSPVVAVVTIDDVEDAVPMARALVAGGIRAIEITLRTKVALDAIRAVAENVPDALPGAGTVLSGQDLSAAERAGARFAVSPGTTPQLLASIEKSALPYLPGSASASEAMWLFAHGYRRQKFFPAEPAGGVEYLRALSGPLPGIKFCPTGGVRVENAATYLKLPNVICVGGSWMTPSNLVKAKDWGAITALARSAAQLRG